MPTPEELGEAFFLKHRDDIYDAARAHEYYLRNRELKGRRAASIRTPLHKSKASQPKTTKLLRSIAKAPSAKKKPATQSTKETLVRIESLRGKLAALEKALQMLTKQAKARSGIETKPEAKAGSASKSSSSSGSAPKPMAEKLTSAQKSAKAKKDKEYYEEHKPPAMKVEELQAKIAEVQQKIAKIKAENPPAKKTGSKRGLDKAGRSPDDPEYGSDPPAKHKTVPVGAGSKHE